MEVNIPKGNNSVDHVSAGSYSRAVRLSQKSTSETNEELSPQLKTSPKGKSISPRSGASPHSPNNLIINMKKDELDRKRAFNELVKEVRKRQKVDVSYDDVLLEELAFKQMEEQTLKEMEEQAQKRAEAEEARQDEALSLELVVEESAVVNHGCVNNSPPGDLSEKSYSWIKDLDILDQMKYTDLLVDFSQGLYGTIHQLKQNCLPKYLMLMKVFDTMPKAKEKYWFPKRRRPTTRVNVADNTEPGTSVNVAENTEPGTSGVPEKPSIGSTATMPRYALHYIERVLKEKKEIHDKWKEMNCEDVLHLKNEYRLNPYYPHPDFSKLMETMAQRPSALVDLCITEEIHNDFVTECTDKYLSISQHTVIATSEPTLEHHDLKSLYFQTWLNDSVINAYLNMLSRRHEKYTGDASCNILNTYFYAGTLGKSHEERILRKKPIFAADLVLIPLHIGGNHWALCAVDHRKRTIKYYDSLSDKGKDCLVRIDDLLSRRAIIEGVEGYEPYTKSIEMVPKQSNFNDCGVFILAFASCIAGDMKFNFSQADIDKFRMKIFLDMKNNKYHI